MEGTLAIAKLGPLFECMYIPTMRGAMHKIKDAATYKQRKTLRYTYNSSALRYYMVNELELYIKRRFMLTFYH